MLVSRTLCAATLLSVAPLSSFATFVTLGSFACAGTGCQPAGVAFRTNSLYVPTLTGSLDKFPLPSGPIQTQYQLSNPPDGVRPRARYTWYSGWFYGTTETGGAQPVGMGGGTIFRIKPNGTFQLLHQFNNIEGAQPYGELLRATFNGRPVMYGTTSMGGIGFGTVFMFDLSTNQVVASYALQGGVNGGHPLDGVTEYNGMLFGTTPGSGALDGGVLFKIDPALGTMTKLFDFGGGMATGQNPSSRLLVVNNMMYGTTSNEGIGGAGVVYSFDPATGVVAVACSFSGGADGGVPNGDLVQRSGKLYGTTQVGGSAGGGTVFKCDPVTHSHVSLHDIGSAPGEGSSPASGLILSGGLLYGTTTSNPGTIFSETP
jgi:uncharacterized repeat protein (TIGR03803 family)